MAKGVWGKNFSTKFALFNLLVIVLGLALILLKRPFLPERLPLFYGRPWGEEQLAPKNSLFLLPVSSFIIFTFNFQMSKFLQKKEEEFLPLALHAFSFLFAVLSNIALWKIIFLIT